MKKPSFLERLTGTGNLDEYEDEFAPESEFDDDGMINDTIEDGLHGVEEEQEGELPIDMYHTGDAIIIRALVAGVSPGDLDIAITRDMVTIKGSREENQEAADEDYYHRELFWGGFSRTILLPEEVLIDEAEAQERHGFLEIVLPKVDKERSARLKVKTNQK